jgi:uncharacterized protein (DUF427 family)
MRPEPDPTGPGQESVWDYPRPPRLEPAVCRIQVVLGGMTIADTTGALRVLETSHPPVYYLPPEVIVPGTLTPTARRSFCEFKGWASYMNVTVGDRTEPDAAWAYASPSPGYEAMAGYVAFYAARMDACYVDGERVQPQPGGFYGGWVTSKVTGPFKGGPGSTFW